MHLNNLKKFYFIDEFDKDHLKNLDDNTAIIYRNYKDKYKENVILEIKKFCISKNLKFFLANNVNLAIKLIDVIKSKLHKMILLGSAHNLREINEKKKQCIDLIFLAPIFKVKKKNTHLGVIKFNNLSKLNNYKSVALGGINKRNINNIKSLNCYGIASISYIKDKLKKINESNRSA